MKCPRFLAAMGTGILSLSAASVLTATIAQCQASFPPDRADGGTQRLPNIVVLIADDLGWNDIGYHGSEIRTPNLDKLAAEGVRLEHHYVYPTCSPTRAGLLTGCNPMRFARYGPIADRSGTALPKDTVTLASMLRTRGYSTALVGKWHLGLRPQVGPRQYGFEQTYGYSLDRVSGFSDGPIVQGRWRSEFRNYQSGVRRGRHTCLRGCQLVPQWRSYGS